MGQQFHEELFFFWVSKSPEKDHISWNLGVFFSSKESGFAGPLRILFLGQAVFFFQVPIYAGRISCIPEQRDSLRQAIGLCIPWDFLCPPLPPLGNIPLKYF
ncbi:hypothetical protein CHS0354_005849 [Potamilus streckersoni]|uniref:Uncharacterized protein n=1 Tax=Potamilus streckersoni TaxID=2493646 RepID=A0AAE0T193_9BIVA|nr:hypothetical protein CHS0354_005849 [Potamilus streckersoni]